MARSYSPCLGAGPTQLADRRAAGDLEAGRSQNQNVVGERGVSKLRIAYPVGKQAALYLVDDRVAADFVPTVIRHVCRVGVGTFGRRPAQWVHCGEWRPVFGC